MISATLQTRFEAFAARLARKAGTIAEAEVEAAALSRKGSSTRWRHAALLWPLFTKG